MKDNKEVVSNVKKFIDNYECGYLTNDSGYKFRTKDFLNVIFLYTNSVDTKNPDILGAENRNTFVFEPMSAIEKIKEQVRLDLKDLNFLIDGASSLARFIPKAANRKILLDNNFAEVMDEIPDNAVEYGSGFLEVFESKDGLKLKSIDPYAIIFDQYNFKDGAKVKSIRTTAQKIIDNEKYDVNARTLLKQKYGNDEDKLKEPLVIYQWVNDIEYDKKGKPKKQEIKIVDLENELVYYEYEGKIILSYYKFDYQKRKGFPDALGKGTVEKVFNKIVQSKLNRERLDKVMEIASKLPFQKAVDNENDNLVGEEVIELETGVILGHKGNPIQPIDVGGVNQVTMIRNEIMGIMNTIGNDLNVGEALQGNTLPSGTSGVLGNLLTENASSVLKEVKKSYANFLDRVYREEIIPYIIGLFDSEEDLRKYLDPNDIKIIERSVRDYLFVQKYIETEISGEVFDPATAMEQIKQDMKGKPIISGELLETVRNEVNGIRTFISGEDISKPQVVAFLQNIRNLYMQNPQVFSDPFFVETIKKEAEFDSGLSGLEIDILLQEIQDNQLQSQLTQQAEQAV